MHCTASVKCLAWLMPFWPVVASSTSSTSCGASGICLPSTRWILVSCCIRFCCVCSRPAVSTMQTSASVSSARATARWATLAGSLPGGPVTISAPSRWAQMVNCSTAAARNVSAAPEHHASCRRTGTCCASLAIEVVLPEPLTPPTMITVGPLGGEADRLGRLRQQLLELLLDLLEHVVHAATTRPRNAVPISSTIAWAACTPMSVLISVANSSSRNCLVDQPALGLEQVADVGVQQLAWSS